MRPLVVFSHGKESGPWGGKITRLAEIARHLKAEVLSVDYTDLRDPDTRVTRLLAQALPEHRHLILVGSSMGGYVSLVASNSLKPEGLFLMAPAIGLPGYLQAKPQFAAHKTMIVHGWNDTVVLPDKVYDFAREHCVELHMLDATHDLSTAMEQTANLFQQFMLEILQLEGSFN